MSKLLQRLSDASKSGVYRTSRTDEILDATKGSSLQVARIGLAGAAGKDALMDHVARAMHFPRWFGGNWDALEDCLTDLSWSKAGGHVLLIEDAQALPPDERGILVDILASAAAWWAERKRPFFAVFLDGPPALPELYKSRR
jgi:barstar (barnase inhibitor)